MRSRFKYPDIYSKGVIEWPDVSNGMDPMLLEIRYDFDGRMNK